jgi:16S rRNA (guanine966-N2)-methyltransferase
MYITGGEFRGRKLCLFSGRSIRPTPAHIRESIFNIIGQDLRGSVVVDLFAGTGVLGLEAVSRGASRAFLVDRSIQALKIIQKNIELLKVEGRVSTLRYDLSHGIGDNVLKLLPAFDLVFIDPPYGKNLIHPVFEQVASDAGLSPGGIIIVEHFVKDFHDTSITALSLSLRRSYGQTTISLFTKDKDESMCSLGGSFHCGS